MVKERSGPRAESRARGQSASPVCYADDFAEYNGLTMSRTKGKKSHSLNLRRIYDDPATSDGARVLVDGIWPRGVKKDDAHLDLWLKSLAPSKELRQWFNHDPEKWKEFRSRYFRELDKDTDAAEALETLREQLARKDVTLLYAARDTSHNNAVALKEYLEKHP